MTPFRGSYQGDSRSALVLLICALCSSSSERQSLKPHLLAIIAGVSPCWLQRQDTETYQNDDHYSNDKIKVIKIMKRVIVQIRAIQVAIITNQQKKKKKCSYKRWSYYYDSITSNLVLFIGISPCLQELNACATVVVKTCLF